MHVLLRLALALSPSSAVIEHIFSLMGMLAPPNRRRMTRDILVNLLFIARDALRAHEYPIADLVRALNEPGPDPKSRGGLRTGDRDPRNDKTKTHPGYPSERLPCGQGKHGAQSAGHIKYDIGRSADIEAQAKAEEAKRKEAKRKEARKDKDGDA